MSRFKRLRKDFPNGSLMLQRDETVSHVHGFLNDQVLSNRIHLKTMVQAQDTIIKIFQDWSWKSKRDNHTCHTGEETDPTARRFLFPRDRKEARSMRRTPTH